MNYVKIWQDSIQLVPFILLILISVIKTSTCQNVVELKGCLSQIEVTHQVKTYLAPSIDPDRKVNCIVDSTINHSLNRSLEGSELTFINYQNYAFIILESYRIARQPNNDIVISTPDLNTESNIEYIKVGKSNGNNSQAIVSGNINDPILDQPIVGATLFINELEIGEVTNPIGRFSLELPVGRYSVDVEALGFESQTVYLEVVGSGEIDFELLKKAIDLDEIVITEQAANENVKQGLTGVETLEITDLKSIPSVGGEVDVLQSILLTPGVSSVGEGALGVNVRGGTVDQNLIMQDGLVMFNASHLLGLYSGFNPDLLSAVTLYKGSIPSRFGGSLSSVLDVELSDGNYQKTSAKGGLGVISSRLLYTMPVIKNKSSLVVAGRASYSDYIFNVMNVAELKNSAAAFYDVSVKYSHRWDKGGINLLFYDSYDRFKFDEQFDYRWYSKGVSLNSNLVLNDNLSFKFTSSYSDYKSNWNESGPRLFDLDSGIKKLRINPYFDLQLGLNFINLGLEYNDYSIDPGNIAPLNMDSPTQELNIEDEQGRSVSFFIEDLIDLNDRIQATVGLRYNLNQTLGPLTYDIYATDSPITEDNIISQQTAASGEVIFTHNNLEPRVSLRIATNDNTSIKMSYARTHQFVNLLANSVSVSPINIWQLSNNNIPVQESDGFSLGVFKNLKQNMYEASIQLFYRSIDNRIIYRDQAQLLINDRIETQILSGEGRAFGVELSIEKKVGRFEGRLGYTYSRSQARTISPILSDALEENSWFNSIFDIPHDVNIIGVYKINQRHSFSASFSYKSGRPITAPVGRLDIGNVSGIPNYSDRNDSRIPSYHRVDLNYTIATSFRKDQKIKSSWTFSIYNVYGRNNPYSIFYKQDASNKPEVNRLSILGNPFPSITYNFSF